MGHAEPPPGGPVGAAVRGPATWPMWLLGLVVFSDQVDTNILRGVLSFLREDFGLSDLQLGLLTSSFVFVNGLVTIPAGYLADRWNRARTIGHTMVAWSGVTVLTAAAPNYGSLLAARSALGFGQAITEPMANSLLADFYALRERGRAYSIQQILGLLGGAAGLGLSALIAGWLSWRWAFLIVGTPSIVVAFLAYRLREPKRGEADRRHVGAEESTGAPAQRPSLPVRQLLRDMPSGLVADMRTIARITTMRYALVGVSVLLFVVTAIGVWLPQFYERHLGVPAEWAPGLLGLLLLFGGIPGILLGGRLADRYVNRIRGGRVVIPAVCIAIGNTFFLVSYLPLLSLGAVLALQLVGLFAITTALPSMRAGLSDAVPAQLRGAGFGAFNLASVLGGQAAAPVVMAGLASAFGGNLRTAFMIVSIPVFFGAWLLFKARHHLEADTQRIFQAILAAVTEHQAREALALAQAGGQAAEGHAGPGRDGHAGPGRDGHAGAERESRAGPGG